MEVPHLVIRGSKWLTRRITLFAITHQRVNTGPASEQQICLARQTVKGKQLSVSVHSLFPALSHAPTPWNSHHSRRHHISLSVRLKEQLQLQGAAFEFHNGGRRKGLHLAGTGTADCKNHKQMHVQLQGPPRQLQGLLQGLLAHADPCDNSATRCQHQYRRSNTPIQRRRSQFPRANFPRPHRCRCHPQSKAYLNQNAYCSKPLFPLHILLRSIHVANLDHSPRPAMKAPEPHPRSGTGKRSLFLSH